MFKVNGGVKQFLAVAVSVACVFFAGSSAFASLGHIEEGKRLLFGQLDMVGAHAEFDAALGDPDYNQQAANFWNAVTAVGSNDALKTQLRDLGIFDTGNRPAIFDEEGEVNYNYESAVDNIIADNDDTAVYSETGDWVDVTDEGYGGNYRLLNSGAGTATWTVAIPTPGYYRVYAWGSPFSVNAQYQIGANPPVLTNSFGNHGKTWVILGTYNLAVGDVSTTLSGNASTGQVKADGVKFEYVGIIKNDTDASFTGTWAAGESENAYMSDYRLHEAGSGDNATWTFSVPDTSKDYLVYAKWPGIDDTAPTYNFTVTASGGSSRTIEIQDFIRKNSWRCLGVFHFPNASGNSVILDSSADGNVAADAVKVVMARPYPDMTASQVILGGSAGTSGMLTQMSEALNNFTFVTTTFSDTIDSELSPMFENDMTVDYGDAKAIEAMFWFQEFNIKLNAATEMDSAEIRPLMCGGGEAYLWLMMLGDYPDLFTSRSGLTNEELTALLGEAKGALISGIDAYLAASDFIRSRSDTSGLNYMISLYSPKPVRADYSSDEEYDEALEEWEIDKANALSFEEYARGKLGEVKENLIDPQSRPYVTIPAYLDEDGYMGTGIDINVNLYAFFSGPKNIRAYMNQIFSGIVRDDFSGVDLEGVLPNFGPADWNYILGNGPFFSQDPIVLWNNDTPSVKLNWDASEDKYYANISKYEVWRVPSIGATKVTPDAVLVGTITDRAVNTYTDTTVSADNDFYYYRLYTYYTGLEGGDTAETYTEAVKATLAVYVDAGTTVSPEKGSKTNPYKDLGEALDEASDGTKVCVAKGTYHESDQTLHMWGKSGLVLEGGYSGVAGNWARDIASNETIIDGTGVGGWSVIMFNEVTGGTLDGFTITGAFMQNESCAVQIMHSSGIVIKNCKIVNNGRGIGLWTNAACSVENCLISESRDQGISLQQGSSVVVSDTTISNNGTVGGNWSGIDVSWNSSITARRINVTQNKGRGIGVGNQSFFDIRDSVISANAERGFDSWSSYGTLFNNLVIDNGKTGIVCAGIDPEGNINVENNTIAGNGENGGFACWTNNSWYELDDQREGQVFSYAGNWQQISDGSANWGGYRLHEAGSGPDTATWTPDIKAAGNYKVYATWTGGAGHSSSAQYDIHYDGGTATVSVNQQNGTLTWPGQLLGTYQFAAGTGGYVTLRESPLGQVVADSIKLEYAPTGSETFKPVLKDNIIVSNNGGPVGPTGKRGISSYSGANAIVSYSDVYGNTNGSYDGPHTDAGGNISADPWFVNLAGGDYHLSQIAAGQAQDSPCLNAGSDTAINKILQGATTRSDGIGDIGTVDMGYHYASTAAPIYKEEVIIDFGDTYGIWIRYNDSSWGELHNVTAKSITTGDIDGNGKDDIIVDFGDSYGIWIYYNNSTWAQLHSLSAESITVADLDHNGQKDIIIDFGSTYGIWIYYNNSAWSQLHNISPKSMIGADLDDDHRMDLIVDFGPQYGIWIYYNNSTWVQLHNISADSIVANDLDTDANSREDIIVDFGDAYGIWIYYNNSTWVKLHSISPVSMALVGDDSGLCDIIVDFGPQYGIWIYYNNSTWGQLHNISAESIATGDIDGNGKGDIIIDFGDAYGIWIRYNDSNWGQLHNISSESITTGELDNS